MPGTSLSLKTIVNVEAIIKKGHGHYTDKIIEVGLKFSDLATAFSNFFQGQSCFVLREFEVNPFVFDPYGNFIPLDGYAVFEPRAESSAVQPVAPLPSIAPFFAPWGVAVVGVSTTNRNSPGTIIAENLLKLGREDVYCINPKGGPMEFNGHTLPVYTSIQEIDAPIDMLVVADTMIDHTELIKTFALLHNYHVNGNRVAIIANAGYEKTYAADNLGGLQVAVFDDEVTQALKAVMPTFITVDPLLDLTPMADDALYEKCIDIVLSSDSVDAVLVSIVPHSVAILSTDSEIERSSDHVAARIVRLVHKHKKPVVVSKSVTGGSDVVYNKFSQTLDAGGVPTFLTASRAMKCLNAFISYHMIRKTDNVGEWLKQT